MDMVEDLFVSAREAVDTVDTGTGSSTSALHFPGFSVGSMPTTTIRIEDDLKERIAAAARLTGKTSHAFILDAVARTVEQVEVDAQFDRLADERWARLIATRQTLAWDEARAYLEARARGEQADRPAPRTPDR
jgi:uncharacterized protein (DUF1778 family)